jgi:hypothetical protein
MRSLSIEIARIATGTIAILAGNERFSVTLSLQISLQTKWSKFNPGVAGGAKRAY